MEEADQLCSMVAIIDHGKIVALDAPEALKKEVGGDVITLELEDPTDMARLRVIYKGRGFATIVSQKNNEVSIAVIDGEHQIPSVLNLASSAGISISSVSLHKPTLNDVFLHHTGHAIREDKETSEMEHVRYRIQSRMK
jgi:ABC-2 type transport system ATP-binding protein